MSDSITSVNHTKTDNMFGSVKESCGSGKESYGNVKWPHRSAKGSYDSVKGLQQIQSWWRSQQEDLLMCKYNKYIPHQGSISHSSVALRDIEPSWWNLFLYSDKNLWSKIWYLNR